MIIGIDPAKTTGIAILDSSGEVVESTTFRADKNLRREYQWLWQKEQLEKLLEKHNVTLAGLEISIVHANPKTGIMLAELGMVIKEVLLDYGVTTYLVSPPQLKKYIGVKGKDNARKEKRRAIVKETFGFEAKSHDIVDAYVLAQIARAGKQMELANTPEKQDVLLSVEILR